jgi:phosphomannomutase/phosphoglucomutase
MNTIAPEIFKAYDIRGIVDKSLTEAAAEAVGRALATMGARKGVTTFVVGRDGRLSGPKLAAALTRGLNAGGMDVVDIGVVATPMVYFATHHLKTGSGVMVTGSHNPPEYNGLKMMVAGDTLSGDTIQELLKTIQSQKYTAAAKTGARSTNDIREPYLDRITSDVKLARKMKVIVDCGNGSPGAIAPELYRRMGCEVTELFCEVDGTFPNHHPDPSKPENLEDLIAELAKGGADVGLAFDGDGDRLGVVTKNGKIIFPDRQLMLFAAEVLSRNPGAEIIFDVKCTRNLFPWIRKHGGRPLLWKTGHSLIKSKLRETGAPLAGEMSGHIFFAHDYYGYDDALYAAVRLIRAVTALGGSLTALRDAMPAMVNTPELRFQVDEVRKFAVVDEVLDRLATSGAEVNRTDGARVNTADGWWLLRASNTQDVLVARAEAKDQDGLDRLVAQIDEQLALSGVARGPQAGH